MNSLKQKLSELPVVAEILELSKEINLKVFVVGGTIRDFLIYKSFPCDRLDIDLITEGCMLPFGNMLAKKTGGSFFVMDKKRGIGRVFIKNRGAMPVTVDLSPLRNGSLENDLGLRDFTMNSITVDLTLLDKGENCFLIDPLNGISDISKRLIRKNSESIFDDDPLRLIRAIRFETQFSLSVESATESLLREKAARISTVSGERIRDEIFIAIRSGRAAHFFHRLKSTGLFDAIFPAAGKTGRRWEDSLDHIRKGESLIRKSSILFKEFKNEIENLLSRNIEDKITRKDLLLFSIIFNETGVEWKRVETICKRLKLSRRSRNILKCITNFRGLYAKLERSGKAADKPLMFSFFRDTGETGIILSLLSIARGRDSSTGGLSEKHIQISENLIRYYYTGFIKLKPLVNGKDLKARFGLKPGPVYKKILDKVDELNSAGLLRDKYEALKYIKEYLHNVTLTP